MGNRGSSGVKPGDAYIIAGLGLPELDSFRREGLNVSRRIDETGTRRAGADVNPYIMVLRRHDGSIEMAEVCRGRNAAKSLSEKGFDTKTHAHCSRRGLYYAYYQKPLFVREVTASKIAGEGLFSGWTEMGGKYGYTMAFITNRQTS